MKMKFLTFFAILLIFALSSCEDSSPTSYVESFIIEGLLIVDEPINGITVMRSQPVTSVFNYDSAMVQDATVKITGDDKEFILQYRPKEQGSIGYYATDSSYLVKPGIEYKLSITLKNGKVITGKTVTPSYTEWVYLPNPNIQFPLDSIKQPASDSISWKKVPGFEFYLISISNLDTLEYGKYLNPPREELNRRVYRPFGGPNAYRERSTMFPIPSGNNQVVQTSVVWNAFRWFGKHEMKVYVPDWNFLRWFLQAQTKGEADPLLSSVDGAIGYFGSASSIKFDFFLLKNQP
jgi:hypothetical protein